LVVGKYSSTNNRRRGGSDFPQSKGVLKRPVLQMERTGVPSRRYTSCMSPLDGIAQTPHKLLVRLQAFHKKLHFLYGNYRLALLWPVAAIVISAIGWELVFSNFQHDRLQLEKQTRDKAEALANSYSFHLAPTLE